jgi:hypothetical protein
VVQSGDSGVPRPDERVEDDVPRRSREGDAAARERGRVLVSAYVLAGGFRSACREDGEAEANF